MAENRLSFLFSTIIIQLSTVLSLQNEINTPQGRIAGLFAKSLKGCDYLSFEGVPYAKPPVGENRFEEPIPCENWTDVYQAKFYPNLCLQWFHLPEDEYNSVVGDEDCLYLNVYTSDPEARKPVLVYIHGGSFLYGSGVQYGPRYIMDHDVVYVSIHYRLGPLGFLSTEDDVVPGNNGLKDQNMALQWIQSHIEYFGGDPSLVTIMGMSAGGASVHYHMLSNKSRNLFHRAISQSGTSFCPWTQQKQPREKAFRLGAHLGCPTNSSRDMVDCLKSRPASAIVRSVPQFMVFDHTPFAPFSPVVEPPTTLDPFLAEHPYTIITRGDAYSVPYMTSVVTHEGLYPGGVYLKNPTHLEEIRENWNEWAPYIYDFYHTLPSEMHLDAVEKIKLEYMDGEDVSMETLDGFIDSMSDRHFVVCMEETVRLQYKENKEATYVYVFGYQGRTSLAQFLANSEKLHGVSHGDDTGYVFDTNYMDPTRDENDTKMIDFMTGMIVSFMADGKPDVGTLWEPVNIENEELNYLKINTPEDVIMERKKSLGKTKFWDSLGIQENGKIFCEN